LSTRQTPVPQPAHSPGTLAGDQLLTQPGPGNSNWAMWQGSDPQDCSAVPARRATWGQIKTLYRR